jgi:hypothetical protein
MYGSERGARGNSRPYRTRRAFIRKWAKVVKFSGAKLD